METSQLSDEGSNQLSKSKAISYKDPKYSTQKKRDYLIESGEKDEQDNYNKDHSEDIQHSQDSEYEEFKNNSDKISQSSVTKPDAQDKVIQKDNPNELRLSNFVANSREEHQDNMRKEEDSNLGIEEDVNANIDSSENRKKACNLKKYLHSTKKEDKRFIENNKESEDSLKAEIVKTLIKTRRSSHYKKTKERIMNQRKNKTEENYTDSDEKRGKGKSEKGGRQKITFSIQDKYKSLENFDEDSYNSEHSQNKNLQQKKK